MFRRILLSVMGLVVLALFSVPALAQTVVVHAGTLLAVPGEAPLRDQSVVIEGGRITAVLDGFVDPDDYGENTRLLDLSGQFVLPGLIDAHTHILGELGPRAKIDNVEMNLSELTLRGVQFANRTLRAGFTTIRDLGGRPDMIFGLRNAINKGFVTGPRILAAGSGVGVTGGHSDVSGYRYELMELFASPTICDGPYECRGATRKTIKLGADVVKIASTGGVLSDAATGTDQQIFDDELAEIVRTAHSLGRKVAAHAHGTDGIIAALRAGVDSIEHGTYTDGEAIELFIANGVYLVPTLLAGETVVRIAKNTDIFPPAIKAKALVVGADLMANFARAYESGVKIAFGTDSGVSHHGDNAQEFLLMQQGGMSASDMIVSATINGADLLGLSDEIGTIEVGKIADLIAVDGDPLLDISELLGVDTVMARGRLIKGAH